MNPADLASLPRCYHPAGDGLGCGRHVGHYGAEDDRHDTTIDLSAELPAAEIARRTDMGMACPCGCKGGPAAPDAAVCGNVRALNTCAKSDAGSR